MIIAVLNALDRPPSHRSTLDAVKSLQQVTTVSHTLGQVYDFMSHTTTNDVLYQALLREYTIYAIIRINRLTPWSSLTVIRFINLVVVLRLPVCTAIVKWLKWLNLLFHSPKTP